MFPLHDENPTELTPYITVTLIALNIAAWVYLQGAGVDSALLYNSFCEWGMIPAELTGLSGAYTGIEIAPGVTCEFRQGHWLGIVTSLFVHGSWLHLISNIWFLWVFGNNIEDSMGHSRFLVFYLLCGVLAGIAHILSEPGSMIPTVGASGAVSGVMGAYLVLYPRVRVKTLFWVIFLAVPAWFVLLVWFLFEFLYWLSGLGLPEPDDIAVWAHIGGFLAGVALVKLFENRRLVRARFAARRLRELEGGGQRGVDRW